MRLAEYETEDLLNIKKERTIGEYCWTLTPCSIRFVFETDSRVERVTYIDADLWFRKNPKPIYDEFEASGKHVLITDHAYAPEYDISESCGKYCVQFMIFSRNDGELVRSWWERSCIDWCFDRFEEGRFGDQKYLEAWPELFAGLVHVLNDDRLLMAPWNATRFPYSGAIAWHFHAAKVVIKRQKFKGLWAGNYYLPAVAVRAVYHHYALDINHAVKEIISNGFKVKSQKMPNIVIRVALVVREVCRSIMRFNVGMLIR